MKTYRKIILSLARHTNTGLDFYMDLPYYEVVEILKEMTGRGD